MSLKDLFTATPDLRNRVTCKTCLIIESLPEEDRVFLVNVLSDREISSPRISSVLISAGHVVSGSAVSRHRLKCR